MWDQEALDLVVPAHITFERNGMGEMQLIAIGAAIDYRVEERDGAPVLFHRDEPPVFQEP
jgi:hypothetical protein